MQQIHEILKTESFSMAFWVPIESPDVTRLRKRNLVILFII